MAPKIDFEEINKIIKILEDRNLADFELEVEGFKIKISRNAQVVFTPAVHSAPALNGAAQNREPAAGGETAEAAVHEPKGNIHYITSPIVGTFYRAPSPTSAPFVEVGDPVAKKQTLCIVEAMKLMNEIECDIDGTIREIFVENAKPVEFGQRLFAIVPNA